MLEVGCCACMVATRCLFCIDLPFGVCAVQMFVPKGLRTRSRRIDIVVSLVRTNAATSAME